MIDNDIYNYIYLFLNHIILYESDVIRYKHDTKSLCPYRALSCRHDKKTNMIRLNTNTLISYF